MSQSKEEIIQKAKKRIDIADKFRLTFLGIALLMLLFLFLGGKVWEAQAWFENAKQTLYPAMTYDVLLMLGCTILKMVLISKYNQMVKL